MKGAASFQGLNWLPHDHSPLSQWHPVRLRISADLPLDQDLLPESRSDTSMSFLQEHLTWHWDESPLCHSEMYDLGWVPWFFGVSVIYHTCKTKRLGQMSINVEILEGEFSPRLRASQKSGRQSLWRWVPKQPRFQQVAYSMLEGNLNI